MRIFLIGMMGAGKTTLGRQLAEKLQIPFVDLDASIEERERKTIPQLFEQDGPEKFREVERQALEAVVSKHEDVVIATGGGTPCFLDNMAFINKHGRSVFLDVPQEIIFDRLRATNLSSRPLLAGKTDEELNAFIAKTLAERQGFYVQATHALVGWKNTIGQLLTLLNIK